MRWMWIDQITTFEPNRRMVAVKNVSLAEEHLHQHFAAGPDGPACPVMPMSLMVEGMAQTAGVLVGSVNRFREKVILAKVNDARIDRDEYLVNRKKAFAKLDANGDGRVGFDEYAAASVVKFRKADRNGDGALAAKEFATTAVKRKAKPACVCGKGDDS